MLAQLDISQMMINTCQCGYIESAKLMINKGAINLNWCIQFACQYGYLWDLPINNGADHFYRCLQYVHDGKHMKIVKLMIKKGPLYDLFRQNHC